MIYNIVVLDPLEFVVYHYMIFFTTYSIPTDIELAILYTLLVFRMYFVLPSYCLPEYFHGNSRGRFMNQLLSIFLIPSKMTLLSIVSYMLTSVKCIPYGRLG